MNLTYFRPKTRGNVENKNNNPVNIRFVDQNIRHQKFIWEHHRWCHVNMSEVATLASMIPNFWCSREVAVTELHLCFVVKGNVWWKRTFLPIVTIVVLHHVCMKLFNPFTPLVSVATGFSVKITRCTKKFTRYEKKSLDLKFLHRNL